MLAKSPTKIAISPTALVPVITRMWRKIGPETKRAGGDDPWAGSFAGVVVAEGVLADMARLSSPRLGWSIGNCG
jgi:hypothetical protein